MPSARAWALPCWLSSIRVKTRKPTAAIGITTISRKKVVKRARKLIERRGGSTGCIGGFRAVHKPSNELADEFLLTARRRRGLRGLHQSSAGRAQAGYANPQRRGLGRGYTKPDRAAVAAARGYSSVGRAP